MNEQTGLYLCFVHLHYFRYKNLERNLHTQRTAFSNLRELSSTWKPKPRDLDSVKSHGHCNLRRGESCELVDNLQDGDFDTRHDTSSLRQTQRTKSWGHLHEACI